MATTEFDIDSYIGEWGYSNRYIKSYLNAAGKNPELIQTVFENLKLDQDFLMTTAPDDILRFLDNEEKSGILRLEIAIKTLIESSYLQPKDQPAMLRRAKELLEYLQTHDTTFSLERVNLMNEIEKRLG